MQHKPKEQGTTALFKNPLLEKLARTHIAIPLIIYFIGCSALLYLNFDRAYTTVWEGVGIFFFGVITWSWFEYFMHKRIFHMSPDNKLKEWIQYTFHGVHHEYPRDKTRLAMPPAAAVIILTLLFLLLYLIIGKYVFTFLPGFIVGYSIYLMIHFAIHTFTPPKGKLGLLWINHSIHHFKDDTVAFGVSSPIWDYILRTMPEKTYKRKAKSKVKV